MEIIKFINFIKFINIAGVLPGAGQVAARDWQLTTETQRTQRFPYELGVLSGLGVAEWACFSAVLPTFVDGLPQPIHSAPNVNCTHDEGAGLQVGARHSKLHLLRCRAPRGMGGRARGRSSSECLAPTSDTLKRLVTRSQV
jgi:hypothetical protein